MYRHLTFTDRQIIEKMYKKKIGVLEIAKVCGVSEATIFRELQRSPTPYCAKTAQAHLEARYQRREEVKRVIFREKKLDRIRMQLKSGQEKVEKLLSDFWREIENTRPAGQEHDVTETQKAKKILDESVFYQKEVKKELNMIEKLRKELEGIENEQDSKKADSCGAGSNSKP